MEGENQVVKDSVELKLREIGNSEKLEQAKNNIPHLIKELLSGGGIPELETATHKLASSMDIAREKVLQNFSIITALYKTSQQTSLSASLAGIGHLELANKLDRYSSPLGNMTNSVIMNSVGSLASLSKHASKASSMYGKTGDERWKELYDTTISKMSLLANVSERLRGSMERLDFVEKSRAGKLSLAEQFLSGNPAPTYGINS